MLYIVSLCPPTGGGGGGGGGDLLFLVPSLSSASSVCFLVNTITFEVF